MKPEKQERLERLAYLLDSSIQIPGTRWRIGLDPILGLIPGLGDAITTLLSGYIVLAAAGEGLPRATLVRMILNILTDTIFSAIPVVGDLGDMAFKANQRNLDLIRRSPSPRVARRRDLWFNSALILGGALVAGLLIYGLLRLLFGAVRFLFVEVFQAGGV
jgi:hypothetical protein